MRISNKNLFIIIFLKIIICKFYEHFFYKNLKEFFNKNILIDIFILLCALFIRYCDEKFFIRIFGDFLNKIYFRIGPGMGTFY